MRPTNPGRIVGPEADLTHRAERREENAGCRLLAAPALLCAALTLGACGNLGKLETAATDCSGAEAEPHRRADACERARTRAHSRLLWRRLRRSETCDPDRQDGRPAGRGLRPPRSGLPGDHPQFRSSQRVRAADRPALCDARPDRARQRHLGTVLGAEPRDGACAGQARLDPRRPGAAGRGGDAGRHRHEQRPRSDGAGAGENQTDDGELLARAGIRGRRHRRRHRGQAPVSIPMARRASSPRWSAMRR